MKCWGIGAGTTGSGFKELTYPILTNKFTHLEKQTNLLNEESRLLGSGDV
jgi:hypothetical protein